MKFHADAEGSHEGIPCPECGSLDTITYRYVEGFEEHECPACGYTDWGEELADLIRDGGELLERRHDLPLPLPRGRIEA